MVEVLLTGLVWGAVVCSIYRGYRQAGQVDRYMALTWTIFVAFAVVFSLRLQWMRQSGGDLPDMANSMPPNLVLTQIVTLIILAAYSLSLKLLVARSPEVHPLRRRHVGLIALAPVVGAVIVALVVLTSLGVLGGAYSLSIMRWLTDGYGTAQCLFVFMPINAALLRSERVFAMRVKHAATLMVCLIFVAGSLLPIVAVPWLLALGRPDVYPYLFGRGPIASVFLVIILIPHRWLMLVWRWWCYARLRALERHLERLVIMRREAISWYRLFDPEQLKLAIYIKVVNILDNYRRADPIKPEAGVLVARIDRIWRSEQSYDELVEALCRMKH